MTTAADPAPARRRIELRGIVQGVGFRPFVYGLARRHGLAGFVRNDGGRVVVEAEGHPAALDAFARALVADAPALARVERLVAEAVAPRGERAFAIRASATAAQPADAALAPIPPDVATCSDCLRELRDPGDRRFRHPFIACTQCGPRFTMVLRTPYDRVSTTMGAFAMCEACRREYEDPSDRRFHAEAIACHDCGPRLSMPLGEAVDVLCGGGVLAVKGLGGFHLACLAGDEDAVARLRSRKHREDKPFAVMAADPEALGDVDPAERALLDGPAAPIVLVRRRPDAAVAASVAPGSPWLGVLRPYTPVHHLLLADVGAPLVMTSGNRSDEPIAIDDREAQRRLAGIADAVLGHDRPIRRRCEDSVVRAAFPIRRSRGVAPGTLALPVPARRPVLAVGAELKSTVCLAHGGEVVLSAHLGDLDDAATHEAFQADVALLAEAAPSPPQLVAHDLHPDYHSTRWALEQDLEPVAVQHHHAHAAACLAEHGRTGPALALVFDGTGLGTDGTLWGGELLRCDLAEFERVAHLDPVPLPGGEAAVREPWRVAAVHLERAGRPVPWKRWPLVRQALRVNAPPSSGMGRLFDAVAALLGVREHVTFEGQAAIELEHLAAGVRAAPYPCRVAGGVLHGTDLVTAAHDDLAAGRPRAHIAAAFHAGVAAAAVQACRTAAEPRVVVLSGGTFQNVRLLREVSDGLRAHGFEVLTHRRVPPNDGGISFGQAAVAARRTDACA